MYFSEKFVFKCTYISDEQSDPNIKPFSIPQKSVHSGTFPELPCSANVV